jgi:hypothetical protein
MPGDRRARAATARPTLQARYVTGAAIRLIERTPVETGPFDRLKDFGPLQFL